MKGRELLILVVLAVVLTGLAVFTSRKGGVSAPDIIGKDIFPDLSLNDVEKVVVYSAQSTVTVARVGEEWVSLDRFNYPLDFEELKRVMLKMVELKIGQVVRVDDNERARLRMISPVSGGSDSGRPAESGGDIADRAGQMGVFIELRGKDDVNLASILVGELHMRKSSGEAGPMGNYPDGCYVSIDGGKTVYLVAGTLGRLPEDATSWLDKDMFSVTSMDIKEITISGPDRKKPVSLVREKDGGDLEVAGLSRREETDASKVYGVASALAYLDFDDVADPSLAGEQLGMDKPIIFEVLTKKGEVYTAKVGSSPEGKEGCYVKFTVALKEPVETESPNVKVKGKKKGESDEEAEEKEDEASKRAEERKELEKKVKSLNEKLGKWTYLIDVDRTDSMVSTRDKLVKKKEKEKKE